MVHEQAPDQLCPEQARHSATHISQEQARRHMDAADRSRIAYVRRLYRADPADPRFYHLLIDSTAIPLDTVVEIILRALSSLPATRTAPRNAPAAAQ
jgi:cytidylate kinase